MAVTDPNYVLAPGDTILVSVVGEPELTATQLIDRAGSVRLPLVEDVTLVRLSVRKAENRIATAYRDREYLRKAEVHLLVTEYAPRFVTVLGAIRAAGKVPFSRDLQQMEIVDVITQSGGLLPVAKGDSVVVTRPQVNDTEATFVVDVAGMMSGKRKDEKARHFLVYPGDRIFIPERLF